MLSAAACALGFPAVNGVQVRVNKQARPYSRSNELPMGLASLAKKRTFGGMLGVNAISEVEEPLARWVAERHFAIINKSQMAEAPRHERARDIAPECSSTHQ